MVDFTSISYLKNGNLKQQMAYKILSENRIMDILCDFDPILVGTVPINIDIENSDLDIICFWEDQRDFREKLVAQFSEFGAFGIRDISIHGQLATVTNFFIDKIEIEIFGQNIPTKSQYGYRHMLIENKLLSEKGDDFRRKIIKLKQQGYKTEPAFAKILGLEGDPYQELLKFETAYSETKKRIN